MRVIAGFHRSRTLLGPEGDKVTRPITDRVKQSLFDRLYSLEMLGGGKVLDLFAGTGSLGIEALSRGAEHCTFVERDRSARGFLEENIRALKLTTQATVLNANIMAGSWMTLLPHKPVNLVFLDPPYAMTTGKEEMPHIAALIEQLGPIVQPGGVLALRTDGNAKPLAAKGWAGPESHAYGSMVLHFYERE